MVLISHAVSEGEGELNEHCLWQWAGSGPVLLRVVGSEDHCVPNCPSSLTALRFYVSEAEMSDVNHELPTKNVQLKPPRKCHGATIFT